MQKIAVAGGSAGALSAAQFVLRHPERCAALILVVPAANVRGSDPVAMSPVQEFLVRRMTSSDFLFWTALKLRREDMVGTLLATDPAVVARGSPTEQLRVNRILREILPVSARTRGMLNDARLAGHPARMDFRDIRVPTLVIYPTGGHVWVGHDEEPWSEVARFLGST